MSKNTPQTGHLGGKPRIFPFDGDVVIPEMPLDINDDGKWLWDRIWAGGSHLDQNLDYAMVLEACIAWQEYAEFRRYIDFEGIPRVYQMLNGAYAANPAYTLRDNALKVFNAAAAQLGLSPNARAKIALEQEETQDRLSGSLIEAAEALRDAAREGDGK